MAQKTEKKEYVGKTKEQKREELEQLGNQIQASVDQLLVDPALVKDFLNWKRQFRDYSFRNSMLIYQQNKHAIGVASFTKWKKDGYSVKRGEKGISIFSPIIEKVVLDQQNQIVSFLNQATDEQKHLIQLGSLHVKEQLTGFQKGIVFDITQTTAPIEQYPKLIQEMYEADDKKDYRIHNLAVNMVLEEKGITLTNHDTANVSASTLGYINQNTRQIYLQDNLTPVAKFKTVVHETAHGLLHQASDLSHDAKEFQAQMVSVVVSDMLHIPATDADLRYIQQHQQQLSPEERYDLMRGVVEVADTLLSTYERAYEYVQTNELSAADRIKAERLGILDQPGLTTQDKQELVHYPAATVKMQHFAIQEHIANTVGQMNAEEKQQFEQENMLFLKKKVIEQEHAFYHVDEMTELMIQPTQDDGMQFHYFSLTGDVTTQEIGSREEALSILHDKGVIPVKKEEMVYASLSHQQSPMLMRNQNREQEALRARERSL